MKKSISEPKMVGPKQLIKKSDAEVFGLHMEVHESPHKQPEQFQKYKEMMLNIEESNMMIKSLNFHPAVSEAAAPTENFSDELLSDDKLEDTSENRKLVSLEEREPYESEVVVPFNWQEELDKIAPVEEMRKSVVKEKKKALHTLCTDKARKSVQAQAEKTYQNNRLETKRPQPVEQSIEPANKKAKLATGDKDSREPFNWHEEMNKRVTARGKSYRCVECGSRGHGHTAVIKHLETFHMKNIKEFKCSNCENICDSFLNFNEHMKIVHKIKLSLLKKNVEEDKSNENNSFSVINESIELQNVGERPFHWREEVKRRALKEGKMLICSVCWFTSKDSLKGQKALLTHIETEHMENLLGFRCQQCGELHKTFVSFNQHLNIVHNIHLNLLLNGSLFMK